MVRGKYGRTLCAASRILAPSTRVAAMRSCSGGNNRRQALKCAPGLGVCVRHCGRVSRPRVNNCFRSVIMGRGDRRTRKGKIWRNSYGKTRPGRAKKKD